MSRKRSHINIFKKYGRLSAYKEVKGTRYSRRILCKCECGNEVIVNLNALLSGNTKSCGCLRKDTTKSHFTKHGLKNHPLYCVWRGIKDRCLNPNCKAYKNYGGRGISVCPEWLEFQPFYKWAVANGYKRGLTIERINNNHNYCPDNCKFIPKAKQSKNRRGLRWIELNGKKKTISDWARTIGISRGSLRDRLKNGWNTQDALTTPNLKNKEAL